VSAEGAATYQVAKIPGDGIGPEIVDATIVVLEAAAGRFGFSLAWTEVLAGGVAIDAYGTAIRDEDLDVLLAQDAVLLGAVGGPKWDDPAATVRPEQGLLRMRKVLGLFANLRPVAVEPSLVEASPLRPDLVAGVDLMIVRELTGDVYFGERRETHDGPDGRQAYDTMIYSEGEVRRITRLAFELARGRRKRLTSVDKANVLASSRLWRTVVEEVAPEYPDVELEHRLVDSTAMSLITKPASFDVIVTGNMFGDILSDEASVLAGSLGMLPSASLGERTTAQPRLVAGQDRPGHRQPHRHHPVGGHDAALVTGPAGGCRRHRERRPGHPGRWHPDRRRHGRPWRGAGLASRGHGRLRRCRGRSPPDQLARPRARERP
jgi:3-isopropylmalate dehydrogenase